MLRSVLCPSHLILLSLTTMMAFADTPADDKLYNGIRLPSPWPPKIESLTLEPMAPPYLADPPDVIPIDVGRQHFSEPTTQPGIIPVIQFSSQTSPGNRRDGILPLWSSATAYGMIRRIAYSKFGI